MSEKNTGRKQEVLAIIPARGGSKGVPRKNIADLGGRPLISYSIDVALKTENISRVVVSTEDEEIAEIAKNCGAEIPFLRPSSLSGDQAIVGKACGYTINRLKTKEGYCPDSWVILFPTSPFRRVSTVTFLVEKLLQGHKTVNTYTPIKIKNKYFLIETINGQIRYIKDQSIQEPGKTYLTPSSYFIGNNRWPAELQKGAYIFSIENPIESLDIDYMHELYFAEEIIKNNMFSF